MASSGTNSSPRSGRSKSLRIGILLAALVLVAIAAAHPAAALADDELGITLTLDRPVIELGGEASLKITVTGPSGSTEPEIPEVDGLDIIARGRTHSVQIINMKVKTSKIFGYAIEPQRPGEFTIGPVRVTRQGTVYESNIVTLKVVESEQVPESNASVSKDVMVEAFVDNATPFVGQQITLVFRFACRSGARIANANYQMPELDDFWNEGKESKREYTRTINGVEYQVTEIAIPLFPIKQGKVTIGKIAFPYSKLVAQDRSQSDPFGGSPFDDDFFQSLFRTERAVPRKIFTAPIELDVRPLPAAGRPNGFKGGVGSFRVQADLSDNKVKEGESVTLTVVLSGEGNIRDLPDPDFDIDRVKTYVDQPSINVKNYKDKVVGEKTYKVALVPQGGNKVRIPSISIPYFNPETGRYEVASSAPLTLKVIPSADEELHFVTPGQTRLARANANANRRDILPIHERYGSIKIDRAGGLWRKSRPIVYPLPVILYGLCFFAAKRRERLRTDIEYRRQHFASKTAGTHIEAAVEASRRKNWDEVFTRCSRSVTEFLADKLNVPVGGLTSSDVGAILSEKGADKEFVSEITKFLEGCDYGRFASPAESPEAAARCIEGARKILERLKREEALR